MKSKQIQKSGNKLQIRVPASTGNLGAGIDVIGLAVKLYLNVSVELTGFKRQDVVFSGEGSEIITRSSNLVLKTIRHILKKYNSPIPGFRLSIENSIPVKRGLGSSGAARLAGVISANFLGGLKLSDTQIISEAILLEGPPDNINSQFTGGMTSSLVLENGTTLYRRCRFPSDVTLVFAVPDFLVSTSDGRKILPKNYPLKDAVYNMQRVALMMDAVRSRDFELMSLLVGDRLHQRYRAKLIPGLQEILAFEPGNGLIGTVLSGSGPTVCALAAYNSEKIGARMKKVFRQLNINAEIKHLKADNSGVLIKVK
ncbi:homoserine kinase [candidate division KSB1 bacterium]